MICLGRFIVVVFLIFLITIGIIVVTVGEELGEHLLNVVQGFFLSLEVYS